MKGQAVTETFLQFGTGNFLRAFADLFVSQEAREGRDPGRIVAVQSTGEDRARQLNERSCRYHVAIRGFSEGKVIDEVEECDAVSRVLVAATQWPELLRVASSPDLKWILSNVTEAGLALDANDLPDGAPPSSFPAKLLLCLRSRFRAGMDGVTILPCELVPENGAVVKKLVMEQAARWEWGFDAEFLAWLGNGCRWINTLVDRIVPGQPLSHPLLQADPLLISAEPFAFWAMEGDPENLPLTTHPAVVTAPDITGYQLRKVRILNGAHTALVTKALPLGIQTVREAVEHPETGAWIRRLLFEEIVPTLEGRVEQPESFAHRTLDRFANPFLDHRLSDIAKGHDGKMTLRLLPTLREFRERFGRDPGILSSLFDGHSIPGSAGIMS